MANKTNISENVEDNQKSELFDNDIVKQLQEQIKIQNEMIAKLQENQNKLQNVPIVQSMVAPTKYITVVSLLPYRLNLWTDSKGRLGNGVCYKFNKFGDFHSISEEDVRKIVMSNFRFFRQGCFYICDDNLIKSMKLDKEYEQLIDKDTFDLLLTVDLTTFKKIYETMVDSQKGILKDIFIAGINDGKKFDMNVVDYIDSTTSNENKKLRTALASYDKEKEKKDEDRD